MIDFDQNECNSIKSIAIKKNLEVYVTTRFIMGEIDVNVFKTFFKEFGI